MTVETWNLEAPPGFQGLHPDIPVTFYYRHLPHWRQDGATYFLTFRLADSLPQAKLRELQSLKRQFAARLGMIGTDWQSVLRKRGQLIPREDWQTFIEDQMKRVEVWLDQGMGECHLRRAGIADIIVDALHHFDEQTYELGAYVVMPNHVHAIMRPLEPKTHPLERILQSRKLHTSREINAKLGQSGSLWQDESFDRIIRDEEHLYRCLQYIGNNPRYANLKPDECRRWVRPTWENLGWRFEA